MPRAKNIDRWGFPLQHPVQESLPKYGPLSPKGKGLVSGLRELGAGQVDGQTFSYDEIAAKCGVSGPYIKQIEFSALKKLRNRTPAELRQILKTLDV